MPNTYVPGPSRLMGERWMTMRDDQPAGFMRIFLVPTLAVLLLIPSFCALGFWQLSRGQEKRDLQAEYDRRASAAPLQLGATLQAPEALQYFRVEASGTYEPEYQVLWDNRIHHGVPGYHVLTPLRIAGTDTRVLVNRGWIAAGDRSDLPVLDVPGEIVQVSGIAVVPRPGFALGDPDALTRSGPTVWQQLDLARYAREVEWPLQPAVILLDPQSAGGYLREWARLDAGIAVHHGYAFQWFALAAAVSVLYVVLMWRALRRRTPTRRGGVA